ncbi:hypothetical protein CPB83DRAFT_843602 [Crepidotus variabilis]|uniref:Uncharacterized protein n=1 Tax=Crepidotus variabilis TaxID=179855 RepID=A0A9P6JWI3_9AGAR|nr:hypothetical protein CPB83DRAFT_843602 [Crepidotus variabilis]
MILSQSHLGSEVFMSTSPLTEMRAENFQVLIALCIILVQLCLITANRLEVLIQRV